MPSGGSKRGQFSAAYAIDMSGFDFRQVPLFATAATPISSGDEWLGSGDSLR
jgi:hypothetical protein